jgi:tripartite-type tricarboxylate transporter receptor subunit TctC
MKARFLAAGLFVLAVAAWAGMASAQTFPSKSIRIVVPFPPGGAADLTSRILAEHLGRGLGQSVVVDNRPGGSTIIGGEIVARSAPDGHTLFVVFPSFVINRAVRSKMPFDPLKDFTAVGQTISVPMLIAVHPSVPASSLQELIALAKAKPGTLAYGTPGVATTHHVVGEMFRLAAKIDIVHAPFQGGGPSLVAVTGGHIPMVYANANEVAPAAKAGKLRALVVTSRERIDLLPAVPTMREAGFPELEASNWSGIVAPAATPPSVIARLNAELVRALQTADVQDRFKTYGMSPAPGTPEEFGAFLKSEAERYAKVAREAGVKAD